MFQPRTRPGLLYLRKRRVYLASKLTARLGAKQVQMHLPCQRTLGLRCVFVLFCVFVRILFYHYLLFAKLHQKLSRPSCGVSVEKTVFCLQITVKQPSLYGSDFALHCNRAVTAAKYFDLFIQVLLQQPRFKTSFSQNCHI